MLYDVLHWFAENWEPITIVIALGVFGSLAIGVAVYFLGKSQMARQLKASSEANLASSAANESYARAEQARAAALTESLKRETELGIQVVQLTHAVEDVKQTLSRDQETHKAEVQALQRTYRESCEQMMHEMTTLKARVRTLETENADLKRDGKRKDARIEELEQSLRGEQQKVILLNTRIVELEAAQKKRDTGPLPPLPGETVSTQAEAEPPATREQPAAPGEAPEGAGEGR
jgi:hypothetical protein